MSWARYANWTVKVLLVLFLLVGFLFPDLPRFEGKAWPLRAMTYPLSALVVPLVWLIKRPDLKYPQLADALLALPFVVDLAGNAANLFDTLTYTDDALHFLNWIFLVAAVSVFVAPLGFHGGTGYLGIGVGSFAIVRWEAVEYFVNAQRRHRTPLELRRYHGRLGFEHRWRRSRRDSRRAAGSWRAYPVKARVTHPLSPPANCHRNLVAAVALPNPAETRSNDTNFTDVPGFTCAAPLEKLTAFWPQGPGPCNLSSRRSMGSSVACYVGSLPGPRILVYHLTSPPFHSR